MTITLHTLTVPVFVRAFANLSAILDKGRDFADAEGIAHDELLTARLWPDMLPLTGQIQRASDTAKGAVVRLAGIANVAFEDNEVSFADLQGRIGKTVDFVKAVQPEAFAGREDAEIVLPGRGPERRASGRDYATAFVLPNFFFHVTTAYALLRQHGVPVGKLDYLGRD